MREVAGFGRFFFLFFFSRDAHCQAGMSKQSQEPGVVLGYEECGHTDASQHSPSTEEKGSAEPKEAERASQS